MIVKWLPWLRPSCPHPVCQEEQGSLVSCSPWDCRAGHDLVTEQQQQVVLVVKNQPANAGDSREEVQSLGWEGPLE